MSSPVSCKRPCPATPVQNPDCSSSISTKSRCNVDWDTEPTPKTHVEGIGYLSEEELIRAKEVDGMMEKVSNMSDKEGAAKTTALRCEGCVYSDSYLLTRADYGSYSHARPWGPME